MMRGLVVGMILLLLMPMVTAEAQPTAPGGLTIGSGVYLSVKKTGSGTGTVTGTGINCGSDCAELFPPSPSTQVTLTAAPAGGSTFSGWSGACSGTGSCVVTMSQARSVTATFTTQVVQGGNEQRCAELGAACRCSEPLQTSTLNVIDNTWRDPADTTASDKECSMLNSPVGIYHGAAIEPNQGDYTMSNQANILALFPAGHQVHWFLRRSEGYLGGFTLGHAPAPPANVVRIAQRFYTYYSSAAQGENDFIFSFETPGSCTNGKLLETPLPTPFTTLVVTLASEPGDAATTNVRVYSYNFTSFTPSQDCCGTGPTLPGHYITKAGWRGRWLRLEQVMWNLSGPDFQYRVYVKDVTNNLPEVEVASVGVPGTELTVPISPPVKMVRQQIDYFRNIDPGGICPGWRAVAYYMQAMWTTNEGQRIGPAYEVEGAGGATGPPSAPTNLQLSGVATPPRRLGGLLVGAMVMMLGAVRLFGRRGRR